MKEVVPELGFPSQERPCREAPKSTHTCQGVDTYHTNCINGDSTLTREAKAMPNRGHTACQLHRKALPFFLSNGPCPSPKRSRTKRGRERRGERQQTIPSHQDGTWACGGCTWPQTQAESSPPSTTAWLVRFPPGAAVHQTDSLSLHLTTRHPVAPRAELWIPPFPLGHGVPAHDIS